MPYIGNKYEIGDHNNSWKPLDDISSYVATFDGSATNAVSTTNNTIRVPEHRFIQGQRVTYTNGGGGNIGGLTSGTAYYIIHDTNNEFKLATSLSNANASTAINLSAVGSGTSHTVTAAFDGVNKKFKITYSGGKSSRFTSATQLTVAINNIVQRANDTATFTDGFGISDNEKIVFNVAPVAADIFWGNILSASLPTFDISDNKLDNFTGNGSATDFTLSHIPANNESIIVTVNGVVQHPTDKNGTRAYSLDASVLVFTAAPANGDEIQVRHIGFAGATTSAVTGFYGRTGNVTLSSSADDAIVGVITATAFSGPFTGVGNSSIQAGILTVTKAHVGGGTTWGEDLVVTGNARVTGILTVGTNSVTITGNDVNITGVTTASNFKTGTSNLHSAGVEVAGVNVLGADTPIGLGATIYNSGAAVFTGIVTTSKLNVTGTSTFNDDSTFYGATSGRNIVWDKSADELKVKDNTKISFGTDRDLQLSHNNSDSVISHIGSATGALKILSGGAQSIECIKAGAVNISHNGNTKLTTTNTGVSITGNNVVSGNVTAVDGTFSGNVSIGGTLTYEDVTNIDSVGVITARDGIRVTGEVGIGTITPTSNLHVANYSGDATIEIESGSSASSILRFGDTDNNDVGQIKYDHSDNSLGLYTANTSEKLRITSGGFLGIGAGANTNKPLHIYTAGADSEIRLQTNSGTEQNSFISLRHATGDLDLFTVVAGTKMKFFTANSERIRITGTGQFHMGGTPGWTYASQKFVVVEPSNSLGMILQGNNANQGVNLTLQNINNGASAYSDLSFADDGGQIFAAVRGKVIDRDNNHGELQFHTSPGSLGLKLTIDKDGKLSSQGSGAQLYLQSSSSSATVNTAVFYAATTGKHNKVQIKTYSNGGGDPFIHFDAGGQNFIVGQRYVGTTNNLLVLGPGDNPDITSGLIIQGTGDVFIGRDGGLSNAKLSIQCDAGEAGIAVQANGSAGATNLLQVYNSAGPNTTTIVQENTTATPALVFKIYDGSSSTDEKVRINQSGLTVTGEVATAQDYPNIRPTLDFNFVQVKKLDPRISFQRTGPASYVDEFGLVKVVGDNEPRFDHDPMTGECKGLLIEEARTNDNKCSINQWDMTGWSVTRLSVQHYPSETAPDGSTNVALVYPNTENSSHYAYVNHAGQNRTGHRTVSAWFKKLSTTTYYPQLRIFGVGNGVAHATFTLTGDGSVSSSGSATNAATITPYPNGWYRCTLSWNHGSAYYGGGWVIGNHASNELPTHTGDADREKGFLVWGFQEESSAWPSSFIPTAGQGVESRQGDEAYITGQDFTDAYNVAEGTFVLKQSVDETSTSNQWGWGVEKSGNRAGFFNGLGFRVGGGGAGYIGAWYNNNGSTSAFFNLNVGATAGTPFTSTLAYKLNDMAATANGITVLTDTSATIATAGEFDRFSLGSYHYDSMSVGHIQRVMYYKKRLPNSQLVTLTS